jgi:MFS family permease
MSLLGRHRDFRLLWAGETVSRFGSSVSTVALPPIAVSVLQATTFEVGLLSAAAWLPWLVIGPTLALLIPLTTNGPGLALYFVGSFCIGVGVVAGNIIKATFHQSYCPPELRGRLAASTSFLNYGTIPLGALLGGTLGEVLGLRTALWITTAGVPLAGLILLFSPIRRQRDLPTHQGSTHQGSAVPAVAAASSRERID